MALPHAARGPQFGHSCHTASNVIVRSVWGYPKGITFYNCFIQNIYQTNTVLQTSKKNRLLKIGGQLKVFREKKSN